MASFFCKNFGNLLKISPSIINKSEIISSVFTSSLTSKKYSTEVKNEPEQQKEQVPIEPQPEQTKQEKKLDKEALKFHPFGLAKATPTFGQLGWQPTTNTHSALMIEGVPFNKTHVVSIKASKNNTIMSLTDYNGNILFTTSAGSVGFKNSKKSTAVAGQGAGLALTENAKRRGIKNIRVVVKGFGNGRLASIKALQMGKLNIISITDNTPIPMPFAKPPRPPAKRRV